MSIKHVTVLGSTGSIGENTIDVVLRHPDRYQIYALTAHSKMDRLAEQAHLTRARVVVVPDTTAANRFRSCWNSPHPIPIIRIGSSGLVDTASDPQTDVVMAAIVGAAGLPSALAAAEAGKRVLLANKEALVAAGSLFMKAVQQHGAELLPIDSEHNAIFQCLPHTGQALAPTEPTPGVNRLILTASGGPFRRHDLVDLQDVTPEQACAHPNWSMGRKISVDSATMLNKGLEVIEAHWLFAMPADRISVVIHPQSVVHSMVEYKDGSVLAQLGQPDMRTPIAYGLAFPDRIDSGVSMLDLTKHGRLDFETPDLDRFPCLSLAYQALKSGPHACLTLNAANEIAVAAFLEHRLPYTWIPRVIEASLEWQAGQSNLALDSLEAILELDAKVRTFAGNLGLVL